jgi:hypothetical protein
VASLDYIVGIGGPVIGWSLITGVLLRFDRRRSRLRARR